ncbi:MAG: hypothetical protein WCC32_13940 [Terriglobales bacterium]
MLGANRSDSQSRTNWQRVDALRDSEIDFSDIPELGRDFFTHATRWPDEKQQIATGKKAIYPPEVKAKS